MITRIMTVEDVQGDMIRKMLRMDHGPMTVAHYRSAHVLFLKRVAGNPTAHRSQTVLLMEVNNGRWITKCPECNAGVTTFRLATEARCFGCGAVFMDVKWPSNIDEVEHLLLRRFPKNRHWLPHETAQDLRDQNKVLGVKD